MKFFLLKSALAFVALVLAIGFGYDYWTNRNALPYHFTHMVYPDTAFDKDVNYGMPKEKTEDLRKAPFKYIFKITRFQTLVTMLDSAEAVNGSGVGFAGAYTWEYACYERLKEICSVEQLVYLTRDRNPVIRIYAYQALYGKDSTQAHVVRNRLLKDTATFECFSGCIKSNESVGMFVSFYREY